MRLGVRAAKVMAPGADLAQGIQCLAVHGQTEDLPELDLSVLEPGVQEALAAARSRFEESAAAAEDDAALATAGQYQVHAFVFDGADSRHDVDGAEQPALRCRG